MAPPKTVELFRGNCISEKAHTWLRTLEGTWRYDTKEEKLYQFEKGLHPGGQADEWWEELKADEKDTWKGLLAAFEKKWPKPKAVRRATEAIIEDLKTNTLNLHELGKYAKDEDGTSVLTHVAWAEGTRKLLMELPNGDGAMLLKSTVRSTLPVAFRRLVSDASLDTWEKWLQAVEAVPLDAIKDAHEDYVTRHPTQEQLADSLSRAHLSPSRVGTAYASPHSVYVPPAARLSQIPAVRQSPVATSYPITTPTPYAPRTPWNARSDDVFGGSTTVRAPNTFTKNLYGSQISPLAGRSRPTSLSGDPARDVDISRQMSQSARMYPADPASVQRYKADLEQWMSQYSNSPSPDYLSFPFTPGTAAPGSRECYRCGILTAPPHYGPSACKSLNSQEVPTRESNIRSIVGQILHPPRQRTAQISQINEIPYNLFGDFDPDQPLYEIESENGEGPAV
ncbi:hypothetical protein MSAN_01141100 [Mycena sanguinolenta]|uniref:Retrotransposon gag domain-containing protein n=1 Tax=Mycena sanguinolenta TaxID=230812 RepID=A0A8H6YH29_9AGAR|nr:hypothetical protein MSAN_01141100 [Mycena sanguinolenta]